MRLKEFDPFKEDICERKAGDSTTQQREFQRMPVCRIMHLARPDPGRPGFLRTRLAPPSGPGVGPVVDFRQVLKIEMGVDLGGLDIRVPEQFLYCPEVTAGFEQMGGERMTQHVRMDAAPEALFPGPESDPLLN